MADKSFRDAKFTQWPLLHLSISCERERKTHQVYGLQIWLTKSRIDFLNDAIPQVKKKHIKIKTLHILTEVMKQYKPL